jgi:hypothetical protein
MINSLRELYNAVENKQIVSAQTENGNTFRFFISTTKQLCYFAKRSSRRGYYVSESEFNKFIKFNENKEKTEEQKLKQQYNVIAKYKKMAGTSTLTNSWINDCLALPTFDEWKNDLKDGARLKCFYAYGITTGNSIDGKVISLNRIEKEFPSAIQRLREAISTQTAVGTIVHCARFSGYDMSISVEQKTCGIMGYLSLEYKGCGNGYYYILINDDNFIGYDVD